MQSDDWNSGRPMYVTDVEGEAVVDMDARRVRRMEVAFTVVVASTRLAAYRDREDGTRLKLVYEMQPADVTVDAPAWVAQFNESSG